MIVLGENALVCAFVAQHGGGQEHHETCATIGWLNSAGKLSGGLVYHHATTRNAYCDIALLDGRFPRPFLWAGLAYPFQQLSLRRLTFNVAASNIKSRALVEGLGAELEATLQDVCSDGSLLIYRLTPANCTIWRKLNEQRRKRPTAAELQGTDS